MPQIDFDIKAAKKAGASNKDIAEYFKSNYKIDFDFEQAATSGVSDDDVISYINQNYGSVKKKDNTASSATPSQLPKISQVSKEGTKKDNAYFKQIAVGIKPSAQGNVVERIYENPMGVEVLQVEPKKREIAPTQPVQKAEIKDKPLRGVKPIAPTNSELNEQGWLLNMVSALDKGVYKTLGTTAQGAGTLLQGVTSKITGGTGEGFVSDALIKFGDSYNKMIDELTPQDESFKGSLSDQVGNALGYVAGLILTGGGSSAARTAGMSVAGRNAATVASQVPKTLPMAVKEAISSVVAPTGIVGGLGMGQAEFDRAKEAGATDEQAFEAFYKNAAMGSILEQIPVMHFLKRFNNATAGGVINYIKTKGVAGITGGVEEMTTEMLQQLYANKTAKDIYNTNQDLFEGVVGNGTIGFSVGSLLNAMGANAKILRKQGKVNEAKLVENQVKELQEKAKGVAPTNNAITTKIAVNGNEEGLQRTQAELDNDLQKGLISEEEYQEKAAIAQKAAEVNVKIPDYVEGVNRAESIELINEREALQQELMQKEEQKKSIDVAYHKSIDESNKEVQKRIDEINNQLGELAKPEKNKVEEEIQQPIEYKRLVEPIKPISEMNSEELYELATKNRKALKGQDKEFFNKSEEEKEAGGYYNAIDDVEDLRDASERINFIENAENVDDLANSVKSILSKRKEGQPNEYELAILNAARRKSVELGVEPKDLIKSIASKVANEYEDASDAEFMVANVLEKLMPKQEQKIQPQLPNQPIEEQGEIVEAVRVEQEPEAKESKSTNKNFTTHKGEVVTGEKLQSALDEVADDYVKMYNSIRKEDKYASHVTEKQKDDALSKGLEFAEKIRIGDGIDNFTVWQRVNEKITGESVPLFSDKTPKNINKEDANESKPQQIDISGKVQSPKPESKEGSPTSPKPSEEGKGNGSPKEKVGGEPIAEAKPKQEDAKPIEPPNVKDDNGNIPVQDYFSNEPIGNGMFDFDEFPIDTEYNTEEKVSVEDIVPTQKNLNFKSFKKRDDKPELIKLNGKYYVFDGHHRIANEIKNGKKYVSALVFDLNDKAKSENYYPQIVEVAELTTERLELLNNDPIRYYEEKNNDKNKKVSYKNVEPKTPLEEKYEQINKLRGEKVKELAKQKLISDNFDSIVAQLMTKNKIKRQC